MATILSRAIAREYNAAWLPVTVAVQDRRGERSIRIEVQHGHGRVQVHWPLDAAAERATSLRDVLK